jgi:hypothetical protein
MRELMRCMKRVAETAQGKALGTLATAVEKTSVRTGTLTGGIAHDVSPTYIVEEDICQESAIMPGIVGRHRRQEKESAVYPFLASRR